MPFQMKCQCGKIYSIPDEYDGITLKCKVCGQVFEAKKANQILNTSELQEDTSENHSDDKKHDSTSNFHNAGTEAYEKAKVASSHAFQALKIMIADPMGGLTKSLELLGDSKAISAGAVFNIIFLIFAFGAEYSYFISPLSAVAKEFNSHATVPLELYLKSVLIAGIPFAVLFGSYYCIAKIFKSVINISTILFTTGVILIPVTVVLIALIFLGFGNYEILFCVDVFAFCIVTLLMYVSLVDLFKLSSQKAVLLTPCIIVLTAYISKVLLYSVFSY
jgi:hypothetical protein